MVTGDRLLMSRRAFVAAFSGMICLFAPANRTFAGEAINTVYAEQRHRARFNLVKRVQKVLTDNRYDAGPVDGIEGPRTAAALKAWQADHGLTADGVIGPATMRSMGLRSE